MVEWRARKKHTRLATNRFVNFIVILSFWTIPFGKRWSRLWCWNGRHSVKEYDAKKCHRNHCIQILLMTFNAFIARLFDRCYEIVKIKRRHRKLFPIDSIKVFFPWIAINELLVRNESIFQTLSNVIFHLKYIFGWLIILRAIFEKSKFIWQYHNLKVKLSFYRNNKS